jgi:N-acetylglutamate synthase-like GNAT family acetyltransferase
VTPDPPDHPDVLHRIERYYDSVPRWGCRTEQIGPFTLFVASAGWPFYARPSAGWAPGTVTADDVTAVRVRQRELGVPEAFEWVGDLAPDLATACRDAGLAVTEVPILVHHDPLAVPVPDGIRIRRLTADDPAVAAGQVVAGIGFAAGGTDVGAADGSERDRLLDARDPAASDHLRAMIRADRSVFVVAEDEGGVLCSGGHNPVGDVTEIVGVATLPAVRRRGLGAAVTDTLVADAVRRGIEVIFLSAHSDAVARVYVRVGFRRVGTGYLAEPPATPAGSDRPG